MSPFPCKLVCIISLELTERLVHSLVVQDVLTFPAGREELPEHVLERYFVRRSKLEWFILQKSVFSSSICQGQIA